MGAYRWGFSRPPPRLWPPLPHSEDQQGKARLPAPMHSRVLRLSAERGSGTSSVATAQLPPGKQAFGPQGHGTPWKEVRVPCGDGESSGRPANADTLAGRCGVADKAAQVSDQERHKQVLHVRSRHFQRRSQTSHFGHRDRTHLATLKETATPAQATRGSQAPLSS